MAMFRYGYATVAEPSVDPAAWTKSVCCGQKSCECGTGKGCRTKVARQVLAKYSPEKYLLSHCFPAGHNVLMADGTEKFIENVQVGEQVITHAGNIRKVTKLITRHVDEELTVINSAHLPEISCTGEHPFYVIKRSDSWCKIFPFYAKSESVKCTFGGKQKCSEYNCLTNGALPDWVNAQDVQIGDRTYTPTLHETRIAIDLNPNRMRLLGYYIAEGRVDNEIKGRPYMIRFSIHVDEMSTIGKEIIHHMDMEFGIKTHSNIIDKKNNPNCVTLSFQSFQHAPWFLKHAGCGSRDKKLSLDVMLSPVTWQAQMMGSWLNGDGNYGKPFTNGSSKGVRLSTASEDLASQAVVILDRLEIHSLSVRVLPVVKPRKPGPYSRIKPFDGWHVCISNSYAARLSPVVEWNIRENAKRLICTKERYRYAASTLSVVKSTSKRRFSGTVYNLSVEEDESYIVNRQAVHNCTIIAAVDVENSPDSKGKYKDFLIHPAYSKFVNNNGDAWTKKIITATFKSFIGANNFLEHVQIPELSKGKVVDAVLREIPIGKDKNGKEMTSYYVDILVATERKHEQLVRQIEAGEMNSMSMGCFLEGTEITLSDGTKIPIQDIHVGDMVLSHAGNIRAVKNTQKRWYKGDILAMKIEGDYKTTYVTPEHPFWAFSKQRTCACGCGEAVPVTLCGHSSKTLNGGLAVPRFKHGHYARVVNPNSNMYSIEEYRNLKESNPIREKLSLGWINGADLQVGDIVSYPVSDTTIASEDATVEKARLIGYFLAEGSFVKDVVFQGEENEYLVKCKICGNLYNNLYTHLRVHDKNVAAYRMEFPNAPVNAKVDRNLIRGDSRKTNSDMPGIVKTRKKIGVEFSLGEHEYDTLNKEIAELAAKVFPNATVLRYPKAIKIMGEDVAAFFSIYGGEYFNDKRLPEEVLYWDKAVQKHLVAAWVIGDMNTTGSKHLADQFRVIMSRLRMVHNMYRVEGSLYKTDVRKMTADGTEVVNHYEGYRSEAHMIQLNFQGMNVIKDELNLAFPYKYSKRLQDISEEKQQKLLNTWKTNNDLGWMIRPIQSIEKVPYEGWVYNFEVFGDNSYIANEIAVHNCKIAFSICTKCGNVAVDETQACDHVRFEKNSTFTDDMGVTRKVAELCGHSDEPDSVQFIDASWVMNPAFTGAVRRSTVAPSPEIAAKFEEVSKKESYQTKAGDFLKVAQDPPKNPPKEPPKDEDAPPPKEDETKDQPPAEAPADDAAPAPGDTGAPADAPAAPAEPPAEEPDELDTVKQNIKKQILKELGDQLTNEMSDEDNSGPRELETLDETMIHPAASKMLKKTVKMKNSWDLFLAKKARSFDKKSYDKLRYGAYILLTAGDVTSLRDYGYNRRDFLAVMSFLDGCFKNPLGVEIKKAMAQLNGTHDKKPEQVATALSNLTGRWDIPVAQLRKAHAWLRAMDRYPK